MKSIVHKNKTIGSKITYPILMRCKDIIPKGKELIVLFTNKNTGIVIASNLSNRPIGSIDSNWTEASDTSTWELFNGVVELSN